jgi:hypothetical protein
MKREPLSHDLLSAIGIMGSLALLLMLSVTPATTPLHDSAAPPADSGATPLPARAATPTLWDLNERTSASVEKEATRQG